MSQLPVIILTHEFYPYPGGIAVYLQELAVALAAAGRQVTVWCPAGDDDGKKLALAAANWRFRVVPIPANGGKQGWGDRLATLRFWRERAAEIRRSQLLLGEPGAVRAACYALFLRFAAPARLSVLLHGSEIFYLTEKFPFPHRRRLLEGLLARAERVGVVSNYCRNLLLARARVAPEKVVIANGALRSDLAAGEVSRRKSEESPPPPAPISSSPSPPTSPPSSPDALFRILCVARIHPRKGQLDLLKAVALLPAAVKSRVHVQFTGRCVRPKYRRELSDFATRHQIQHGISEAEAVADLAAFYAQADLFALTSLNHGRSFESFGLVYLEAGAFSLPVLGYDSGGVADAVRDGETGILVGEGDIAALAEALQRLIEEDSLRNRLAHNGLLHSRTFSWAESAANLLGDLD